MQATMCSSCMLYILVLKNFLHGHFWGHVSDVCILGPDGESMQGPRTGAQMLNLRHWAALAGEGKACSAGEGKACMQTMWPYYVDWLNCKYGLVEPKYKLSSY